MSITIFGLTGGIASGKSTVAARWRERGVPVIDADDLAREVVLPGTDGLAAIVAAFGAGVLAPDGTLDRKKLAAVAFASDGARRELEAITHPRITTAGMAKAMQAAAAGHPLACYEASLLVERGAADAFRPLVVVAAPERVQIERAMRRDGCSEAEARARLEAQLPLARKTAVADHVIENVGDLDALVGAADGVLDDICEKLGVPVARYPAPNAR